MRCLRPPHTDYVTISFSPLEWSKTRINIFLILNFAITLKIECKSDEHTSRRQREKSRSERVRVVRKEKNSNKIERSEASTRRDRIVGRSEKERRFWSAHRRAHSHLRRIGKDTFYFTYFFFPSWSWALHWRKVQLCVQKSVWNRQKIDKIDFSLVISYSIHKRILVDGVPAAAAAGRCEMVQSAREKQYCAKCLRKYHFFERRTKRGEAKKNLYINHWNRGERRANERARAKKTTEIMSLAVYWL